MTTTERPDRIVKAPAAAFTLVLLTATIAVPVYSSGLLLGVHVLCVLILIPLAVFAFRDRLLCGLWIVASLWSFAQLVSDWTNGTQIGSQPTVIGPATALLATYLVWLARENRIQPASILIAVSLGWFAVGVVVGDAATRGNAWKYGLAYPAALFVLAIAQRLNAKRGVYVLILVALAGVSLLADARFAAGLFLVTAALVLLFRPSTPDKKPRSRITLVLALAAILCVYFAYPTIALSGSLGDRAYEQQVRYEAEGADFLIATRMELPQMAALAIQNPVLGVGANGVVTAEESAQALDFVNGLVPLTQQDIFYLQSENAGSTGYRAHSAAMASFLYAGFLALPFWIFLIVRSVKGISQIARGVGYFAAPALFLVGLAGWDMFFSPLTNRMHLELGVLFFVLWVVNDRAAGRPVDPAASPMRGERQSATAPLRS